LAKVLTLSFIKSNIHDQGNYTKARSSKTMHRDSFSDAIAVTTNRHNNNLMQSYLVDIVMEARLNYAKGKRTKGGLFGWTGI